MCFLKPNSSDVDVYHCRLDIRVSEDALKAEWITPILDIVSCECVPEDVRCDSNSIQLRSLGNSFDDSLYVAEFEPITILGQIERSAFLMESAHFNPLAHGSQECPPHVYVPLLVAFAAAYAHGSRAKIHILKIKIARASCRERV